MENSWQVKCGSSTQTMASSTSQEPRNQIEMDSGHYIYSHAVHDLRSAVQGRVQDLMTPNIQNINSSRLAHDELGNSFLALLSGPPSLSQCDFQEPSNSKAFRASSSKLAIDGSGLTMHAVGSGVSPIVSGPPSEHQSNQNMQNGANRFFAVSSRAPVNSNFDSNFVLHDGIQAANLSLPGSDLAKAVIHKLVPGNEKAKDSSSMKGEWHQTSSANARKLRNSTISMSEKVPLDTNSSLSNQSSICTSGCPRIICLGASGDLLLSNTGLLGIVCSCHCFHMSVANFCEHLGLCDVNPGDVVRMESGETIARWRKLYFQKFGIRVPDDRSGWDWPEALSAAAGLVNSSVSTPNIPSNSDLAKLVGSSGGLSGQPLDNIGIPKNARTDQSLVIDALHDKEQRYGQDSSNYLLKGLVNSFQSNLGESRCSTVSKFVDRGTNSSLHSISGYIDSPVQSRNVSIVHPASQISRTVDKNYDVSKIENPHNGVMAARIATPSNIELRLGQPYQQSHSSGNSVPSVIGSKLLETFVGSSKSLFLQQMIHSATNCEEKGESRQYFQCSAGLSNLSVRKEQSQLNLGNHVCGLSNAMDAATLEKFEGNVIRSSVVPLPAHFTSPPERNANCKADNNIVSSDHIVPKSLYCESHTQKSELVSVPWSLRNGSERQFNVSEFGFLKFADKGKAVGCTADGSYASTDSEFRIQKQLVEPGMSTGAMAASNDLCFSDVHQKSPNSHQSSGVPPEAFDTRNHFYHPEKPPCIGSSGHINHAVLRSMVTPADSGKILQSQVVSMAFPSATSTSIGGMIPAASKPERIDASPFLLDDDMRLLALRQIVELSKQQHALSSHGMDREKGRLGSLSNANIQHPFIDDPLTFGEQRLGPNLTTQQIVSEVAMASSSSGAFTRLGVNIEKSVPVTGLNNFCDFSTLKQGNPINSREIDLQYQFPRNPLPNKQLSFRSENATQSSECVKCCHGVPCRYFQCRCNFAGYTKCFGEHCESRVGSSLKSFNELVQNVNAEASVLVASEFVKDQAVPQGKSTSLDQRGKLKGELPKNIVCHTSQWRDVPSKFKGVSDVTCLDQSPDMLDSRAHIESQVGDAAAKGSYGTSRIPDSLKDQEMSNVSSGCSSAAAVTQASVQVNNMDSSTVNAGNTRYMNNLVVDEGSGIDKCWSSDDAFESERSAEFLGANCKTKFSKEGSSKVINNHPSRSLLDELKLIDSMTWKKGRNQIHTRPIVHGKINLKKIVRGSKTGKRKKAKKLTTLEATSPAGGPSLVNYEYFPKGTGTFEPCVSKDVEDPSTQETYTTGAFSNCTLSKCGRSTLSSSNELSRKRDLHIICNGRDGNDDCLLEMSQNTDPCKIHEFSSSKKVRKAWTSDCIRRSQMEELTYSDPEDTVRCNSVGSMKASSSHELNICYRRARPVVCGKYGEISSGKLDEDESRPVKIVPLSRVLKSARRCTLPKNCKPKPIILNELIKCSNSEADFNGFSDLKKEEVIGIHQASFCSEMNIDTTVKGGIQCTNGNEISSDELTISEKESDHKSKKGCSVLNSNVHSKLKLKNRKRSLFELTVKGKESCSGSFPLVKISKGMPKVEQQKTLKNAEGSKHQVRGLCKVNIEKSSQEHRSLSIMDSDAFCCVCGGSNKDEINCLLECSRCFIKVHQACYGVSRVPKGHWYCRPCRTSSKDIVCVLCGYGGGAMTLALRSRMIVKSLLKAWNFESECRSKNAVSATKIMEGDLDVLHFSGSIHEVQFPVLRPFDIEPSTAAIWKVDLQKQLDISQNSSPCVNNLRIHNSVTDGVLDSTVKQWIHMVCGLWTPGTRCPNVDTMSAFDVSGASHPKANVVCSICSRPGGSCIQCRVANCRVKFHPWCAHQKGLLQSEVEGVENESVGFYGRCLLHATLLLRESGSDPIDIKLESAVEKEELTCARIEGYKGRKRDGFWYNRYGQSNGKSGCLVPQEQLNAWIHINGQKSSPQGIQKLPVSDIESDCRKEYTRYRQSKGWKHLVVYKSGIHALGLYTSRFISRGEMVVEYVGEIVGLRVADKRENEYQSGRKLQYKSACYFFRIDKEHIIDATCKGGIARFVNHSCLPNCVARVISVRNEKKVVFFAERDIYPGEEITYDYHFNHEDEGKKIPCFCNSKNCRRYLN
ncbi:hypothetical protein Ddye_006214 [Dipteronia dyeriana]|uniref:Histone-lysine N-methyltransferase n=1 Tax=Dipteronia dyeriana TaxID=168575 RepID=A0AAE0CQI5_9ROSI|nr:hypothetical protein Ddye_006214 [Dipteronia dyeriana]